MIAVYDSRRSAVDAGHVRLVVALARGRREVVQAVELGGAEFDAVGSGVFLDAGNPPGSGDGSDVVAAGQQPRQRGLCRRGSDLGADGLHLVDDAQVALEVLAGEPRVGLAPVVIGEVVHGADPPGQQAMAERRVGNEPGPEPAQERQDFDLEVAGPERVFGLQRGHRTHGMRPADRIGTGLGQSDVAYLAFGDQLGQRADRLFDGRVRVDAVLVVEVDVVGAEPLERAFDRGLHIVGAAVDDAGAAARVGDETELRRHDDAVAPALDGLADNFLAMEGAVDLGGVDVRDPEVQRPVNGADRLGVIEPPAGGVDAGHSHGSQTDAGDIKPAQRYMLHQVLLWHYDEPNPASAAGHLGLARFRSAVAIPDNRLPRARRSCCWQVYWQPTPRPGIPA